MVIGNFDGVHLGHQSLIAHARKVAEQRCLPLVILTFEPHPRQFFNPLGDKFRITPPFVKEQILQNLCDRLVVLDFNQDMAGHTAAEFIQNILLDMCHAAVVVVGDNFHFGKGRGGTPETLKSCPRFETVIYTLSQIDGQAVSSSRIRNHLRAAEMGRANALLGRPWVIEGIVIHGDKRGREIGYPTANIGFGDMLTPSYGVYAVEVKIDGDDQWRGGAANIGIRPMFETVHPMLEVYIFDFDGDLYGQTLQVRPIQKLRDEMKFDGLDALIAQIEKDCKRAKIILLKK